MKTHLQQLLGIGLLLGLLCACDPQEPKHADSTLPPSSSQPSTQISSDLQESVEEPLSRNSDDSKQPLRALANWNQFLNEQEVEGLRELYDPSVNYYGKTYTAAQVIEDKQRFFKKNPDFQQELGWGVDQAEFPIGHFRLFFSKKVTLNGEVDDIPSVLIFAKKGDRWKIIHESDKFTDAVLEKKLHPDRSKLIGDYDGDGITEKAVLVKPERGEGTECGLSCEGTCITRITFPGTDIPDCLIEPSIGGQLLNEGDLNGDGTDELSLIDSWCTSCWGSMHLKTYRNGRWESLIEPFGINRCMYEEQPVDRIARSAREGWLYLLDEDLDTLEGDWRSFEKEVPIPQE